MGSENGSLMTRHKVDENVALIFGVTGLVGRELVNRLLTEKNRWRIYGVARKPEICSMTKNMGSLCVYGAICKYLNLPFVFGGTRECWEESYIDGSDSNLVAEQHIFAATSGRVLEKGEAFNAINGVGFTWKEIWPDIGRKLGVQVNETTMFDEGFWFGREMAERKYVWGEIVIKEKIVRTEIEDLANWVFLDVLFRFPVKLLGKREKVDRFGFKRKYRTLDSILYWIDVMRDEKLIPL